MNNLTARRMKLEDRVDAAALLAMLIRSDEIVGHSGAYGGAGEDVAIHRALDLFLQRPELGFTWLAFENSKPVGLATVCFAISTNLGSMVAKVPDFVVAPDLRGRSVGKFMMETLVQELRAIGAGRIDLGVHDNNDGARRFYKREGFVENHELGMSLVL